VGDLPWKNLGLKDFKPCIFEHIYVSCYIGEGIIARVPTVDLRLCSSVQ
jgi:hypothetical protein